MTKPVKVLFVCLGNICRSPTAHGIFDQLVKEAGLQDQIHIDSAGTSDWHVGKAPDSRTVARARQRGYDLSPLRARQFVCSDFDQFDYVLGMDDSNMANMRQLHPGKFDGTFELFLNFGSRQDYREVPDPYYGGEKGFDLVIDLVEQASEGLLTHIRQHHLDSYHLVEK
ncbi:low molecular weight protein-tyrosine-phosphatase [Porticoccaceae bacterium LTM1]|nr:low molecular weight protein-tyrosine-phosphatase [Porticoccaceae bacterium LTM1]